MGAQFKFWKYTTLQLVAPPKLARMIGPNNPKQPLEGTFFCLSCLGPAFSSFGLPRFVRSPYISTCESRMFRSAARVEHRDVKAQDMGSSQSFGKHITVTKTRESCISQMRPPRHQLSQALPSSLKDNVVFRTVPNH